MQQIFPQLLIKLDRSQNKSNLIYQNIRREDIYLPNAKNPEYRGIDEDLRVHSFLNKKCINEQYVQKVSEIFIKVVS